jgi:DNA gyrase subunit A
MGNIIEKELALVQKENMLNYFISIMYDRALADIRDGCKPIHRFVLWDMYDLGVTSNKPHKKCARVVGDTIGRFNK